MSEASFVKLYYTVYLLFLSQKYCIVRSCCVYRCLHFLIVRSLLTSKPSPSNYNIHIHGIVSKASLFISWSRFLSSCLIARHKVFLFHTRSSRQIAALPIRLYYCFEQRFYSRVHDYCTLQSTLFSMHSYACFAWFRRVNSSSPCTGTTTGRCAPSSSCDSRTSSTIANIRWQSASSRRVRRPPPTPPPPTLMLHWVWVSNSLLDVNTTFPLDCT